MLFVLTGGPVAVPRGTSLLPLWIAGTGAAVAAVIAVHILRAGRVRVPFLLIGALVVTGVAAVVLLAVVAGGPVRFLGLTGRALIPGVWVMGIGAAVGVTLALADALRPSGRAVLMSVAVASAAIADVGVVSRGGALRDLKLYLIAGERFLAGAPPYQTTPLTQTFGDQTLYPFLYPPPILPVLGLLSLLPLLLVGTAIIGLGVGSGVAALRLLRVRWPWVPILLLWPPFFEGIWVGNVAVPALVLLAVAFRFARGATWLALGPLLKVQAAIPALWLIRQRLWRELAVGLLIAGGICLLTLPFVGLGSWGDWVSGLRAFQQSQAALPVLYSFALPRVVPYPLFLAIAVAAVAWGLSRPGLDGLRWLGIASVVASPSLYRHGLLAIVPALVTLDAALIWLVMGSPVTYYGVWACVVIASLGLLFGRAAGAHLIVDRVPSA